MISFIKKEEKIVTKISMDSIQKFSVISYFLEHVLVFTVSVKIAMYSVRLINSARNKKTTKECYPKNERSLVYYICLPFIVSARFFLTHINYDVFRLVYKTFFLSLSPSAVAAAGVSERLFGLLCLRKSATKKIKD